MGGRPISITWGVVSRHDHFCSPTTEGFPLSCKEAIEAVFEIMAHADKIRILKHPIFGRTPMNTARKGEKIGWSAGWLGGFIWVAILSIVFLYQKKVGQGVWGIVLTGAAIIAVLHFAPWRHPTTPYWKLMMVPYGMFFISIAWAVWSYGGMEAIGLNWWNLLWIIPCLSPLGMLSKRKWSDSDTQ